VRRVQTDLYKAAACLDLTLRLYFKILWDSVCLNSFILKLSRSAENNEVLWSTIKHATFRYQNFDGSTCYVMHSITTSRFQIVGYAIWYSISGQVWYGIWKKNIHSRKKHSFSCFFFISPNHESKIKTELLK